MEKSKEKLKEDILEQERELWIAVIEDWHNDITLFAKDALDIDLRPKQIEIAEAFRTKSQIAVKGGSGFGKTAVMAIIVWWSLITHDEVQVTIVGPTAQNLTDNFWKEFSVLYEKLPQKLKDEFTLQATQAHRNENPKNCFASFKAVSKDNIAAARGTHKRNNFVIADEATGIDDIIFTEALLNVLVDPNAKLCLVSNPNKLNCYFHRVFTDEAIRDDWTRITGTMADNPELTREKHDLMARSRGGVTSSTYRIMVMGEFPLSDTETLIPHENIERAVSNTEVVPSVTAPVFWGLDPAGKGRDASVLCIRHDNTVLGFHEWHQLAAVPLCNSILDLYNKTPRDKRPSKICVDSGGLGDPIFSILKEMGLPVLGVPFNGSPTRKPELYANRRAQIWVEARDWFTDYEREVSIPNHTKFIEELASPKYKEVPKYQIEPKEEVKKRIGRSPDFADAFCLTFAAPKIMNWGEKRNSDFVNSVRNNASMYE